MNKALHTLLTNEGFNNWKNTTSDSIDVCKYQKRVDSLFPDAPLCTTNDKLHINVEYSRIELPDRLSGDLFAHNTHEGVEISLCHGNKDDIWFDLKAYSINPNELIDRPELLDEMIEKLIGAWKVVNL